jgi:hypothetical protein
MQIGCENGNTLWQDDTCLEMVKVWITFQILNNDESTPLTYEQIHCHMVFNMKMEDFCRKGRIRSWWSHDQDSCN